MRKDPYRRPVSRATWVARLILLFIATTTCFAAAFLLYGRWQATTRAGSLILGESDPALNPAERLYLEAYLAARAEALTAPAGRGEGLVRFIVTPGETANEIAQGLAQEDLLRNTDLFLNYLRYRGFDSGLEAGTYLLDPRATIPELAVALTQATAQEVELRFLEGWRLEEMAAYLDTVKAAEIDADQFLELARRQMPLDAASHAFLADLPAQQSLEGYLFPDTYRVTLDAQAADLISQMLRNFDQRVTPSLRAAFANNGLTLHQAVTLASIVERETPLEGERPMVAGVFYNRLSLGMRLQADPTVQYAVGFDASGNSWWKSPLTAADLEISSPYNTYRNEGLPPGPIANPGLASLEAVANPAVTNNLYFVADCDAAGSHLFSETYEAHLANVQRCRS